MKYKISLGLILITVFAVFQWKSARVSQPSNLQEPSSKTEKVSALPRSRPLIPSARTSEEINNKRKNDDEENFFHSPEKVEALKKVIIDALDTIDPQKRIVFLKKSKVDTQTNAIAAISVVTGQYSSPPSREEALKKILALHFLEMTEHFDSRKAVLALEELSIAHQKATHPRTQKAFLMDFQDLARALHKNNREELVGLRERIGSGEFKKFINQLISKRGKET